MWISANSSGGRVDRVSARTAVGICALVALLGVAIYLLFQIPREFAIGGVVALAGIFAAVAHDAPDPL
jgi:hypothetical protein